MKSYGLQTKDGIYLLWRYEISYVLHNLKQNIDLKEKCKFVLNCYFKLIIVLQYIDNNSIYNEC